MQISDQQQLNASDNGVSLIAHCSRMQLPHDKYRVLSSIYNFGTS